MERADLPSRLRYPFRFERVNVQLCRAWTGESHFGCDLPHGGRGQSLLAPLADEIEDGLLAFGECFHGNSCSIPNTCSVARIPSRAGPLKSRGSGECCSYSEGFLASGHTLHSHSKSFLVFPES